MVHSSSALEMEPLPDSLVGKTLADRFHIIEKLGAGGMGVVYKAIQSPMERVVALKVLNPSRRSPSFERRFLTEGALATQLIHPNTAAVLECGKGDDDCYFVAMEYVEGVTLEDLLVNEGALPWLRALAIAQQICEAVREAHQLGILHRDIKPANVMMTREGDDEIVKILDFGLLESVAPPEEQAEAERLPTHTLFVGSPLYMAPEQAKNRPEERSDIYSLGVLLYEMLTGRPPFVSEHSIDVVFSHLKEVVPSLRSVVPNLDCPPELEAIVLKCLEKDPASRPQTMDELRRMLTAVLDPNEAAVLSAARGLSLSLSRAWVERLHHQLERRLVPLGLMLGAGLACLLWWAGTRFKHAEPHPLNPSSSIRFRVDSDPEGAQVALGGHELGATPLQFELDPDPTGQAAAELTFSKDGYEARTVKAAGTGPTVVLSQRLEKIARSR